MFPDIWIHGLVGGLVERLRRLDRHGRQIEEIGDTPDRRVGIVEELLAEQDEEPITIEAIEPALQLLGVATSGLLRAPEEDRIHVVRIVPVHVELSGQP